MSDEESFVILGSSPYPSLCPNGNSLLRDALDGKDKKSIAENVEAVSGPASLSNLCASQTLNQVNDLPSTLPSNVITEPKSLAASFILGEVKSDVLKNSVYSQFPSLCSMQACAEDVVKLQNLMTEYLALKQTLDKVNHTMQDYFKITQEWRKEAATRELQYQNQLKQCQEQIEKLQEENQKLKNDLETNLLQIRMVEEIRQKEQDDLRQSVSEKTSLIQNMRVEIDKLQQLQMHSFEYVPEEGNKAEKKDKQDSLEFVKRDEHDRQVKELKREMSVLLAENLETKDMKKTYIEEIDCLKVNLTSAQELIEKMQRDVNDLKARDACKQEEIEHLKTQNEIYRRDFEMERADREKNAGEKDQYLLDLRALQRRNQELIESLDEARKGHKTSLSSSSSSSLSSSKSSLREEQRPVRVLDPTGAAAQTTANVLRCPICSKSFAALNVLQSHVNDCLDKN